MAIAYLFGLLLIGVGELLLQVLPVSQAAGWCSDLVAVNKVGSGPIIAVYLHVYREAQVLAGSSIALLLLAIGAFLDARNLPGVKWVVYIASGGTIVASALVFLLAILKSRAAHALVEGF